jgi:hypothetical protein
MKNIKNAYFNNFYYLYIYIKNSKKNEIMGLKPLNECELL